MQLKISHILIFMCISVIIYLLIDRYIIKNTDVKVKDSFDDYIGQQNPANIKINIIDLYTQLLDRQPSSIELNKNTRDIEQGTISIYGLRQSILDSNEYKNSAKLQSNSLNPELTKMVSDKQIIDSIAAIYNDELDKIIPPKMVLPLRDIYIHLGYNEYALRAMFRDSAYPSFEADCINTPDLDKNQTMDIFNEYFSKSKLIKAGNIIASVMKKLTPSNSLNCALTNLAHRSIDLYDNILGGAFSQIINGAATPSPLSEAQRAQQAFNTNVAAREMSEGNFTLDFNSESTKKIPVQNGPYILLPEMAWAVPQPRAPVCTSLGQPQLIQPVMTESKLLLQGLPIEEAATQTGVGSIMPKFKMQQYIDVPNMSISKLLPTQSSLSLNANLPSFSASLNLNNPKKNVNLSQNTYNLTSVVQAGSNVAAPSASASNVSTSAPGSNVSAPGSNVAPK